MREQYVAQVKRRLMLSRKTKREVLRDLDEIFDSALEHGETEEQVIARLGTPKDFADSVTGPSGTVSQARRGAAASAAALTVSVAAFLLYAFGRSGKTPEGAIGYADAMTSIRLAGTARFDALQLLLAAGAIAAVFAAFRIICTARKGG